MRVGIVIPCHNVAGYVMDAVASVCEGQGDGLDLVCVDDGSTDGTNEVLLEAARRWPGQLRIHRQEKRGASAARNTGMRMVEGRYLQFLDADDRLLPGKIPAQMELAHREGDADLVVGDYEKVMPNGLLLPELAMTGRPWMALIRTRMGTTSSALWKREAVERAGGWDEQLASSQDYELMFRMLRHGARVAWDGTIRTRVLKREVGSISRTDEKANWQRYIALRRAMMDHLRATDAKGYALEIETLRQYIFMALRIIAQDDLPAAEQAYREHIGPGFKPWLGKAITERYALLHQCLGFGAAERSLRKLRELRPPRT